MLVIGENLMIDFSEQGFTFPFLNAFVNSPFLNLLITHFTSQRVKLFFIYIFIMNIYIGNLNYAVGEDQLQGVMEDFGAVNSVKIIVDRETGRSKGFGFVEMDNEEDARRAIEELNGAEFEGRTMVVKEARPRD